MDDLGIAVFLETSIYQFLPASLMWTEEKQDFDRSPCRTCGQMQQQWWEQRRERVSAVLVNISRGYKGISFHTHKWIVGYRIPFRYAYSLNSILHCCPPVTTCFLCNSDWNCTSWGSQMHISTVTAVWKAVKRACSFDCCRLWRFPRIEVPLNHPFIDGFSIYKPSSVFGVPPWLWKPPYPGDSSWWNHPFFGISQTGDPGSWSDLEYQRCCLKNIESKCRHHLH